MTAVVARSGGVDPALRTLAQRRPSQRVGVIIQFLPSLSQQRASALVRAAGGQRVVPVPLIHGIGAEISAGQAFALSRTHAVHAISLNAVVHGQSTTLAPGQLATWFNQSASTQNLWTKWTGLGIGVAVIDSGVQGDLPDFQSGQSNPSSRVIASAVVNPYATSPGDPLGHGTMVAGLIGGNSTARPATDPLFGKYVGSAPDANIVSVKVGDDQGDATVLDVLYGIQFAIDHKATYNIRVINLSLESDSPQSYATDPLDAAVEAAWFDGITVVVAAGNRGTGPGAVNYAPANDPYVITVGAVGDTQTINHLVQVKQQQDQQAEKALSNPGQRQALKQQDHADEQALQQSAGLPAPWSSAGTTQDGFQKPDIYGPGRYLSSVLAPGSVFASSCPACVIAGQYLTASGTSLATPIVSGAVADLLQAHPSWTPAMVKGALLHTAAALPKASGAAPGSNTGMLNANAALGAGADKLTSDQGLSPSSLVVMPGTGGADPSWANWDRSSWSAATGDLNAPWARSSWSCDCSRTPDGSIDPTRSSWSRSSWSLNFETP